MIGDNDRLSAIVATSVHAELLVLLSDIDGLYTADPHTDPQHAQLIPTVEKLTPQIMKLGGGVGSAFATGGMATKLQAAAICMEEGCDMVIMNGTQVKQLYDVLNGAPVGTRFLGKRKKEK